MMGGFNLDFYLHLGLFCGDHQPLLIDSSMMFPLANFGVGVGFSSFDVQSVTLGEGADDAGFS